MISADQLNRLKALFAQDGTNVTDAQALRIGLWLLARVRPIVCPLPLDKTELFATIKREDASLRQTGKFLNLHLSCQQRRSRTATRKEDVHL